MTWMETYPAHRQPDMKQIRRYMVSPYWRQLLAWLEDTFHMSPRIEYSRCSTQGRWDVKYRERSRAVCTSYPEEGYSIRMVSVGAKGAPEAGPALNGCAVYIHQPYQDTAPFNRGRWMMMEVRDGDMLEDVKGLVGTWVRKKRSV